MPRRVRGAAEVDGILVGLHEPGPVGAHLEVVGLEFPILARILQAGSEASGLFLSADVQKELQEDHAISGDVLFKCVDLIVTRPPGCRRLEFQHADDQHILVMRPVEDADIAGARHGFVHPPQKIMG